MSSTSSKQARIVIELFCSILEENNISTIRAETLRQAKFNNDAVTEQIAWVLLRVIQFCENNVLPDQKISSNANGKMLKYVKSKLQAWGYLCRSVATVPDDLSHGSRALLLALGWVVHTQKLMDKIIGQRSNPLQQNLHHFCQRHSQSNEPDASVAMDPLRLTEKLSPQEKIQQQLMLTGKVRMSMRRLYSVTMQKSSLVHTVENCTRGVSLQAHLDHLTPLEVHLLRYPSSMKQMLQTLEQDNEELRHLLEWREKSNIFWEWMGSVLILDQQEREKSSVTPRDDVEEVYLPTPTNLGEQIADARSRLRDFILSHESAMEKVEQLILRKKVSQVEKEVASMHIDQELNGLAYALRDCGRGLDVTERSNLDTHETTCSPFLSLNEPEPFKPTLRQKVSMKSEKASKVDREAKIVEAANMEIRRLKNKVEKLERKLKERQVSHMQVLQEVINKDENYICIQPRCFKQLLD